MFINLNQANFSRAFQFLILALPSFFSFSVQADCFMIQELGAPTAVISEGNCQKRVSPCSTFKIPIALMGFESSILKDAQNPVMPFKAEYESAMPTCLDKWKAPHNPTQWMKNSCIWYSQVITQTLGVDKLKNYVQLFNYGNQDVSGDPGKNNGLTRSWLSSSLKISPQEQVEFIAKILKDNIPVDSQAVELTKQILLADSIHKEWNLYGKTGAGNQLNDDGTYSDDRKMGWFVGWISKKPTKTELASKQYIFAYLLEDQKPGKASTGVKAKEQAEKRLKAFIKGLS